MVGERVTPNSLFKFIEQVVGKESLSFRYTKNITVQPLPLTHFHVYK